MLLLNYTYFQQTCVTDHVANGNKVESEATFSVNWSLLGRKARSVFRIMDLITDLGPDAGLLAGLFSCGS